MASNGSMIEDVNEAGEFPGRIELYNAGTTVIEPGGKSQPGSLSGLVSKLLIKRTIRAVSVRRQLVQAEIGR